METTHRTTAMDAEKLTEQDVTRLLEAFGRSLTGTRDRALAALLAESGLRIGEALALTTEDLKYQAGQLTHVLVRRGKRGKAAKQPVGQAGAAVMQWLEKHASLGIGDGPLFCTVSQGKRPAHFATGEGELTPGKSLSPRQVRVALGRAGEEAGLAMHVHPHLLRHFAVTRYLRANGNLELTRKFARHSDVQTTARVYSHLTQDDVDAGMAKLPGNGNAAPADPEALALAAKIAALTPEQRQALAALLGA